MNNPAPICCGAEARWVNNGPSLQYFFCDECKQEPSSAAESKPVMNRYTGEVAQPQGRWPKDKYGIPYNPDNEVHKPKQLSITQYGMTIKFDKGNDEIEKFVKQWFPPLEKREDEQVAKLRAALAFSTVLIDPPSYPSGTGLRARHYIGGECIKDNYQSPYFSLEAIKPPHEKLFFTEVPLPEAGTYNYWFDASGIGARLREDSDPDTLDWVTVQGPCTLRGTSNDDLCVNYLQWVR